jgi:hypothetical protein
MWKRPNERGPMKLRALFLMALWVSIAGGSVQLLDGRVTHVVAGVATVVVGLLIAKAVVAVRLRWRRVRSWPKPGETELFPAGPRRVLLADTGLADRR